MPGFFLPPGMLVFAVVVTLLAIVPVGAVVLVLSALDLLGEPIRWFLTFGDSLREGASLVLWLLIGFVASLAYAIWCRVAW